MLVSRAPSPALPVVSVRAVSLRVGCSLAGGTSPVANRADADRVAINRISAFWVNVESSLPETFFLGHVR
jgi:hypothetical protein